VVEAEEEGAEAAVTAEAAATEAAATEADEAGVGAARPLGWVWALALLATMAAMAAMAATDTTTVAGVASWSIPHMGRDPAASGFAGSERQIPPPHNSKKPRLMVSAEAPSMQDCRAVSLEKVPTPQLTNLTTVLLSYSVTRGHQ